MIAEHLRVSAKALVAAIPGEHDFADLPGGVADRKSREHRYVAKRFIVMIDEFIEDRHE
jgi:hypothetical protein